MKTKTFSIPLRAWELGHQLTLDVYRLTQEYPREERYGIVSQMRRAAFSVPSNLVEGHKRSYQREKARFYNIAEASLSELRYFFFLSHDLGYISESQYETLEPQGEENARVLSGLVKAIRARRK